MSEDEPYNAADEVQIKAKTKRERIKKEDYKKFVGDIMQTKIGRAWLWDLIEGTSPTGFPVVPGDVYLTYFNLGKQDVGKRLLAEALQFTDLYLRMAVEAKRG